jgi:hypothetical protein
MKKMLLLGALAMIFLFAGAAQKNIIPNPSLENGNLFEQWGSPQDSRPDKWHPGYRVDNSSFFAYHWAGHSGGECVRVEITKNASGDAKWYFEPVPVEAGKLYEVTDWYIANTESRMYAAFGLSNGKIVIVPLRPTPAYAAGWTAYYDTVKAPGNAVNVTVFHSIEKIGWMMTDDYYMGLAPYDVALMESSKAPALAAATKRKARIARDEEIRIILENAGKMKLPEMDRDLMIPAVNT